MERKKIMAKQEVIQNLFDGGQLDIYDRKYLKYLPVPQNDRNYNEIIKALRTHDINAIENSIKGIANIVNNGMSILGMVCMIIERERLYDGTEYGWSYLRYAEHLVEELNIPIATLSDSKIIMERFVDYQKPLIKAGFVLERNANKLRYLDDALENHDDKDEVFRRIANDSFRAFRDWAQKKTLLIAHRPEPEARVNVEIKGNKLLVDGKNILNFPKNLPEKTKKQVSSDLEKTFSIREGGNQPFILGTYDKGEQTALENFLKKYRAKK
jgi:hypothetical protein